MLRVMNEVDSLCPLEDLVVPRRASPSHLFFENSTRFLQAAA